MKSFPPKFPTTTTKIQIKRFALFLFSSFFLVLINSSGIVSISQPLCMITLTHRTEYNNFILVSLKPYNNDSPRFRSNPVTVIRLIRTIVLLLQLLNFISSQKYLVWKRKFIIDKLIFEPGERVVDNHTGHFSCLSTRHRGGKENFYSLLLVVLDQIVPPTFL